MQYFALNRSQIFTYAVNSNLPPLSLPTSGKRVIRSTILGFFRATLCRCCREHEETVSHIFDSRLSPTATSLKAELGFRDKKAYTFVEGLIAGFG